MQAIVTRYVPATNTKPSRIKASCVRGSVLTSYPHELSGDAVHEYAAAALVAKFCAADRKEYGTPIEKNPWNQPRVSGWLPSGGMAHIFTSLPLIVAPARAYLEQASVSNRAALRNALEAL